MYQAVSVTAGKLMDAIVVDTKHVAAECIRCVCVCVCVCEGICMTVCESILSLGMSIYMCINMHASFKPVAVPCAMCDIQSFSLISPSNSLP